ncbi:hypothetical protein N7522_006560 [Penicillium canescens]|uniref:Uncharacterized protein n=1 Tax=Penicillium canescens TaxID=5083 RepID=A0AAD6I8I0_PENCN|nr:uncharacterized protein N7446_010390 [Penicillium canescens]KAJ6001333.1 hypothetical protein N7522_006560 [Penicillium canescens]KAJ6035629.1 hypothetical protein N7460_009804 [Penicillium canescens]KAJ6037751.1 hypothetical protein N7444_010456 [Penicillium canescens]KAJ6054378.1 hypothetical protein N7446_010390 [Penicillium canescens]
MGVYPIQLDHYRAPEIILGCAWNMSIDIWNLGILVRLARHVPLRLMISLTSCQLWNIIQGKEMFSQIHGPQGHYQAKAHLADMISLLGHLPLELIARSQSMSGYKWPELVISADGVTCENAEQYFDDQFFDHNGYNSRSKSRGNDVLARRTGKSELLLLCEDDAGGAPSFLTNEENQRVIEIR